MFDIKSPKRLGTLETGPFSLSVFIKKSTAAEFQLF